MALPAWFEGTIFDTYPYLLPNLVCTSIVICGLAVGILFLEETHEDRKYDHDQGRAVGRWLLTKLRCGQEAPSSYARLSDKDALLDETDAMLPNPYTSASPTLCSTRSSMSDPPPFALEKQTTTTAAPTLRDAFSKQVCLNIVCYGILAL